MFARLSRITSLTTFVGRSDVTMPLTPPLRAVPNEPAELFSFATSNTVDSRSIRAIISLLCSKQLLQNVPRWRNW